MPDHPAAVPAGGRRIAPPGDFRTRPPTWDDLDAVTALHATAARDRLGHARLRREDLRVRWLGLATLDEALLVEHPDAAGPVAYAAFEADHDPVDDQLDLHIDAVVHPAWTGRGLASFLLDRALDRARRAARDAGHDTAVLTTALVDGDEPARLFHADRGFVAVRHLLDLRLDLHARPPVPVWPTTVRSRSYLDTDAGALWSAHQAAFADVPTHLPLTFDEFRAHRLDPAAGFDPSLTRLAVTAEDDVVGLLIARAGTEVAAEDGWVRDLGVVPAWRRHGIGMALLRTAFQAFRERGLTGVALEVDDVTLDGAVALYRRAGMRIVHRTDVLAREIVTAPDAAPTP
jgi:mycothiol synthase